MHTFDRVNHTKVDNTCIGFLFLPYTFYVSISWVLILVEEKIGSEPCKMNLCMRQKAAAYIWTLTFRLVRRFLYIGARAQTRDLRDVTKCQQSCQTGFPSQMAGSGDETSPCR